MQMAQRGSRLLAPTACSEEELGEFEALVRAGFDGSDGELPRRVRRARRLAFHRSPDGELIAIAALKRPGERERRAVFGRARAGVRPADYRLELGWVFVVPAQRGHRYGEALCRDLLGTPTARGIFATTRPDNQPMIRLLGRLGFDRAGVPYVHLRRDEELVLFLRPPGSKPPGHNAPGAG